MLTSPSTPFHADAVLATPVTVSTVPCGLTSMHVSSVNTNAMYLLFYDALIADVTVGTTVAKWKCMIPGGSATAPGGCDTFPKDLAFNTALSIAATTALTGNTAPGTGLNVNLGTARI